MYCNNCGEVLELGQAICSKCGTPVVGSQVKKEEKIEEVKETKIVKKKKLKKTPIICLIVIFLIFLSIVVFWDKLIYLSKKNSKNNTTTTVTTKAETPENEDTRELLNSREILLENQTDKIIINYYKDEIIESNSIDVVRDILFNDKVLVDNEVVATSLEEYSQETIYDKDVNNFKTFSLMDQNGTDVQNVLIFKTYHSEEKNDHHFLIFNSNGIKLMDKTVVLYGRGVYLEASTREELGDRTIKEVLPNYQAYLNEEYMNTPIDIVNNELRVLMFSDEENVIAKEIKYIVNNGEVNEEVMNTFDSTSTIIREYGEKLKVIE